MRINVNVSAIVSNNALQRAESKLSKSIERLSSGYKINSSADDAAGCAIAERMRVQIRGLEQADNNTADGISVINTAEGALIEVNAMLSRMKELTVQAANDVNSDSERGAIQDEIDQINKEIDRISAETEFNTQPLLNGNLSRRVYSNYSGVKQLECSDGFVAGEYGISITKDATQAAMNIGPINMANTDTITKELEGSILLNGYKVEFKEGDSFDTVFSKIVEAADMIGANGYADKTAKTVNILTDKYGSDQSIIMTCDNKALANLFGIPDALKEEGMRSQGSDVVADFSNPRKGFEDSAVMSTKGTIITVKDVNNKSFQVDVTGEIFAKHNNGKQSVELVQEVTDVGTMSIHVGANENQVIKIDVPEVTAYTLGTENLNVMTSITASKSIDTIDSATAKVNAVRAQLGAYANRLEHTTNNLAVSTENMTSALSTMVDTDMAEEMTEYTSLQVLTQAATSILSQANERPSGVLSLLQG